MALPHQRVTTTESFSGRGLTRCSTCKTAGVPLQRNMDRKWVCGKCDPSLELSIRVVPDDEAPAKK